MILLLLLQEDRGGGPRTAQNQISVKLRLGISYSRGGWGPKLFRSSDYAILPGAILPLVLWCHFAGTRRKLGLCGLGALKGLRCIPDGSLRCTLTAPEGDEESFRPGCFRLSSHHLAQQFCLSMLLIPLGTMTSSTNALQAKAVAYQFLKAIFSPRLWQMTTTLHDSDLPFSGCRCGGAGMTLSCSQWHEQLCKAYYVIKVSQTSSGKGKYPYCM